MRGEIEILREYNLTQKSMEGEDGIHSPDGRIPPRQRREHSIIIRRKDGSRCRQIIDLVIEIEEILIQWLLFYFLKYKVM